jgi:hypothetical protein
MDHRHDRLLFQAARAAIVEEPRTKATFSKVGALRRRLTPCIPTEVRSSLAVNA